jgi:hypothetical protein
LAIFSPRFNEMLGGGGLVLIIFESRKKITVLKLCVSIAPESMPDQPSGTAPFSGSTHGISGQQPAQ